MDLDEDTTRSRVVSTADGARLTIRAWLLIVEGGPDKGRELALGDRPVVIGRGDKADFRIDDPTVSREHARLEPQGPGWRIVDNGSKSGVWVDGLEVKEATLHQGARVKVGDSVLRLKEREAEIRTALPTGTSFRGMIGASLQMRRLFGLLERVAPLDLPILLHGETGTGKEVLARTLHDLSSQKAGPYVVVDCTLLGDETHARSELFGHTKGSFTGADRARDGAFVQAHTGTLMLDEIGDLTPAIQAQLLRVLQEGEVRGLGASDTQRVRVRVVSATHRDLQAMVTAGSFRRDLYHRLAGVVLEIPPLRAREGDLEPLSKAFLPPGASLEPAAEGALRKYAWPGNVRELQATLQRAAALAGGRPIGADDLGLSGGDDSLEVSTSGALMRSDVLESGRSRMARLDDAAIVTALEQAGGNRDKAAEILGISRASLFRRLKTLREKE